MFLINSSYYQIKETPRKGRGVFAKSEIEPGVVIGDYLGKIVKTDDAIKTEHLGTYYMEATNSFSILADKKVVGIHLINHSCAPNCGTVDYKGRAVYVSIRKIYKGEELTVNYNYGPPNKKTCNPCRHECHCGSRFCKGTMHTSTHKDNENIQGYSKNSTAFTQELKNRRGKDLLALPKYPKKISDDSYFDLFGNEKLTPTIVKNTHIPSIKELRSLIRESGRTLAFPNLKLLVYGVVGDSFFSTILKKK